MSDYHTRERMNTIDLSEPEAPAPVNRVHTAPYKVSQFFFPFGLPLLVPGFVGGILSAIAATETKKNDLNPNPKTYQLITALTIVTWVSLPVSLAREMMMHWTGAARLGFAFDLGSIAARLYLVGICIKQWFDVGKCNGMKSEKVQGKYGPLSGTTLCDYFLGGLSLEVISITLYLLVTVSYMCVHWSRRNSNRDVITSA